ncbi:hypothetical protein EJB05_16046 [Eragrostis curvula]|uniref:Serine carboxypeptidase-like 19 n=1 Tax=Eragrostis curvula TaxID=38414 RepID=A0A5J9VE39_9POAL|nr:hypothetical protein EJB05_16046 [Eragrostis curvula]
MSGPRLLLRRFSLLCLCSCFLYITQAQLANDSSSFGSSSKRVVTSLPGFDGRLPFHLETGYVEVDEDYGTELFYYFIESEAAADEVPFLLWLTGGHRCSVLSGLAFEIGPIRFVLEPYNGTLPRLRYDHNSWTKLWWGSGVSGDPEGNTQHGEWMGFGLRTGWRVSHVLFVDSPVGSGFSFSRHSNGYKVGDLSSSQQLHEFLIKWFNDHPEYLASPFYIGGDSYAGKIIPFLVQKISEDIEARRTPLLNLKGYLVGNPSTGENIDTSSKVPFAHGVGIISDQLYETILGHCHGEDYTNPANVLCARALDTFNNLLNEVMQGQILIDKCVLVSPGANSDRTVDESGGRKMLKEETIRELLNNPPPRPPLNCVSYGYYLSYFWANDRRTREALGIKKGSVDEWVRCRSDDTAYWVDIKSSIKYHRNVTSKGYRALVYSGDHDAVVPHLGTQAWVRSLNFSVVDDWRAWHVGGQAAGWVAVSPVTCVFFV